MIKCFCDRCGNEIPKDKTAVSTKYLSHKLNEYEVCLDCIQAFGIWMGSPENDPTALKAIWKPGDTAEEEILCCPHCGKPLETNGIGDKEERRFCPKCGRPFTFLTWEENTTALNRLLEERKKRNMLKEFKKHNDEIVRREKQEEDGCPDCDEGLDAFCTQLEKQKGETKEE